jgi:hypothetical protein
LARRAARWRCAGCATTESARCPQAYGPLTPPALRHAARLVGQCIAVAPSARRKHFHSWLMGLWQKYARRHAFRRSWRVRPRASACRRPRDDTAGCALQPCITQNAEPRARTPRDQREPECTMVLAQCAHGRRRRSSDLLLLALEARFWELAGTISGTVENRSTSCHSGCTSRNDHPSHGPVATCSQYATLCSCQRMKRRLPSWETTRARASRTAWQRRYADR